MPKIGWSTFVDRSPAAHLIVGIVPEEESGSTKLRHRLDLLAMLLVRLNLEGLYALAIYRNGATPEIQCAFERITDARRVAQALQTGAVGRYPGWRSQREFGFDRAAVKTIKAALREVNR